MSKVGYLTHSGLIVQTSMLKQIFGRKYADFLKKMTIIHHPKIGPPKYATLYETAEIGGAKCTLLPRTHIDLMRKIMTIEILFAPVRPIIAPMPPGLYENQLVLVNYLVNNVYTPARLSTGSACAILNLRAGMGKTFVAAGIVSKLGMRTLYVVPNQPLMVQAAADLHCCFSNEQNSDDTANMVDTAARPVRVGKFKTGRPVADDDITIIVINSALNQLAEFFEQYSFIILDEVHMYCADKRRKIFKRTSWAVLGMSATTEQRKDGFDTISHKELAFDGIIRAENVPGFKYEESDAFDADVEVIRYNGPPEFTQNLTHESTGRLFTPYMINQFLRDTIRTRMAVAEIKKLYDWIGPAGQQHNIYVFCEERQPLDGIYSELVKLGEVNAPEIGTFIGGIKTEAITEIKNNARILLTTYGYSGTGVSINKMTAIVFLTPRRSNMLQILARILRRGGDRSIRRKIIDIVDNKTALKYQHCERRLAYEFYQMNISEKKVMFSEVA